MSNPDKKPIIGILGGIGSGKSTVAGEFVKLGCKVIDADKIVYELLNTPDVKQKLIDCFGQKILDCAGKINHKSLADVVFADKDKLTLLNSIIHPLVLEQAEKMINQYNKQKPVKAIVLDMPLLVEVGWDKKCETIIFVDCKRELRVKRCRKNGDFNENQLKIRENFQISLDNKRNIADNTISNNSGFEVLAEQAVDIFNIVISKG